MYERRVRLTRLFDKMQRWKGFTWMTNVTAVANNDHSNIFKVLLEKKGNRRITTCSCDSTYKCIP